jgi:hypothetical protein
VEPIVETIDDGVDDDVKPEAVPATLKKPAVGVCHGAPTVALVEAQSATWMPVHYVTDPYTLPTKEFDGVSTFVSVHILLPSGITNKTMKCSVDTETKKALLLEVVWPALMADNNTTFRKWPSTDHLSFMREIKVRETLGKMPRDEKTKKIKSYATIALPFTVSDDIVDIELKGLKGKKEDRALARSVVVTFKKQDERAAKVDWDDSSDEENY